MLKYLIIPLAEDAVSFCHYNSGNGNREIPVDILKKAIPWAMKENVSVQFLYPSSDLSPEVMKLVNEIEHVDIVPHNIANDDLKTSAEIVVFDDWNSVETFEFVKGCSYVIRTSLPDLLCHEKELRDALHKADRINIIFTDWDLIKEDNLKDYNNFLQGLISVIVKIYTSGRPVQLNLLTDRLMLKEMNNCNAGYESITLAPNGKFYTCPAFYYEDLESIGDLDKGLDVKNSQLYKLSHSPICRKCEAFQCKRCVWLNKKMTREINTPSHEQCVMAHYERNVSRNLLTELRNIYPDYLSEIDIPTVYYLDPFDKIVNRK